MNNFLLRRKTLFSPLFVYAAIWLFILSLYSTKTLDWGPLHKNFYLALLLNFLGLFGGYLSGKLKLKSSINRDRIFYINNFKNKIFSKRNKIKKIYKLYCLLGFMGISIMFITIFRQISISDFFAFQAFVKSELNRNILGIYLASFSFVALSLGVILQNFFKLSKIYYIVPLLLCFLYSFSFFGRVPFIMAIIIAISGKILLNLIENTTRKKRRLYLFKLLSLGIFVIILIYSFLSWTIYWRTQEYEKDYNPIKNLVNENVITHLFERYEFMFGSKTAALMTYSYLVASIPTLNYWVSQESELALGQASFPYFYRLAYKSGFSSEPIVGDRPLGKGMQLPTFLGYAYIDFGFFGVFIYSFILGFLSTVIYHNFLKKPKLISYFYLIIIYVVILLSPQTFAFHITFIPLILFYMVITNFLIVKLKF